MCNPSAAMPCSGPYANPGHHDHHDAACAAGSKHPFWCCADRHISQMFMHPCLLLASQELQQRLAGVSETLSSTDRQQCEQDLAEVERRTYILQARLVITPAQARRDMQEAAVGCAQLHEQRRRDPYDENLQSLFVVAAIRVVSLAVYEEIAEHLCKSIMVEGGDDSPAEGAAIMA